MNKFGMQYFDKSYELLSENREILNEQIEQYAEIRKVLQQFQAGYRARDLEKVDEFIEELFFKGENTYAVGTSTGELFLGSEQVKELIKGDWEYWGDVNIDWENTRIDLDGEVSWFATTGSVKYTFEDTPEKYDRHINLLKDKIKESGLTPKQKITYINWFLSLVYHQREGKKREYLWPMFLSGVMLKDEEKWKFTNLKFSIPRANFPDERFENSKAFLESYNNRNAMISQYKNNCMTSELKVLLKSLETEFFGKKQISNGLMSKYFASDNQPYVIAPENLCYEGIDRIREFFNFYGDSTLSLDLEHAIASKSERITCVTVTGTLKQELTEDELAERALDELDNIIKTDITSKEKIFAAHRSIAYILKESSIGPSYTCPIRLTAVIINGGQEPVFHQLHFSYPFYWILEGKLDSI